MARPKMLGLRFFPVDVDMFDDEKMIAVSGEYGLKGEITVVKLLCMVYREGYYALWDESHKYRLLRELPGVSSDLLESIIQRLVRWGFFDESLFNSTRVLTSRAIQRRFFSAIRRRTIDDGELPYLLCEKPVCRAAGHDAGVPDSPSASARNKKHTTSDRRVIFRPPTVEEVRTVIEERGYHFSANTFVDFYQSKGWMVGKSKMKDWRAALSTWETRYKSEIAPRRRKTAETKDVNELWKT